MQSLYFVSNYMHKILVSLHTFDYVLGESNQPYQSITCVHGLLGCVSTVQCPE